MIGRVAEGGESSSRGTLVPAGLLGPVLLVVSWTVTRAVLFAQTFSGDTPADVQAYARWAQDAVAGLSPAADTAFVYPPGAVALFFVVDVIPTDSYFRSFTLFAALVDFVILFSLWWVVRRASLRQRVAPWVWVAMGLAAGPLMYERFDIFAALLGVLAILSLHRPLISGAWAAVGFMVKLWPEIALLGVARQHLARAVTMNLLVVGALLVASELMWGRTSDVIANIVNKGLSVEATAAYPFLLLRSTGSGHGVTGQYGSWEVVGPGVELAALLTSVVGIALLFSILVLRILGRIESAVPGDVVLLGVLVFVASHKINSLQYGVWIAAVVAAAISFRGSQALGPGVLLTLMLVVADQVIWDNFVAFISGNPLFLGYQGVRLALLLSATGWIGWTVLRGAVASGEIQESGVSAR